MSSSAFSGMGTLVKVGDGATPENFTTIAEVKGDIVGPGKTWDEADVTNHSSPNRTEEIIVTIKRLGTVTFDVNFLPTNATHNAVTGLQADRDNGTKRNFQLVAPDGSSTTYSFTAYVKEFTPTWSMTGAVSASVTLRLTA